MENKKMFDMILSLLGEMNFLEDVEFIEHDTNLISNGLIDSLGIMYLISELEERYKIQIHIEEVTEDTFGSINNIISYVNFKLKGLYHEDL